MPASHPTYAFSGAWNPVAGKTITPSQQTFSLGIYPLLPKADGKGFKQGKCVTRVYGIVDWAEKCTNLAQRIVDALNSGAITPEQFVKKNFYSYGNDYDDFERDHNLHRS